ncbi:MAG: hypothetical protein LBL93_01250, partial [Ruminococcus sp.]|nr:hypothetical protein [Ruminococcus sp.]
MKTILTYIQKYWKKHILSAVTLMFSAVLMTAVLVCSLLIYRGEIARKVYDGYDSVGFFDDFWGGVSDDTLAQMQSDKHLTTGYMSIIGKGGSSLLQYTAGSLYDENNLARIQFESGKMPEISGEIAITRQALDNLNWLGKVGENITLEINNAEETFKVSGIISAKYGDGQGWQSSEVSEVQGAFAGEYPIPQIFLSNADAEKYEVLYKNVMFLENISDFQRYENQTSSEIRE